MPTAISDPTLANNAYATVAEATTYFALTDAQKELDWVDDGNREYYMIQASKLLDDHFVWIGERAAEGQNMEWPRKDVPRDGVFARPTKDPTDALDEYITMRYGTSSDEELSETTIPTFLVEATAELALQLLKNNAAGTDSFDDPNSSTSNIKKQKVDVLEVEYFDTKDINRSVALREGAIPPMVYQKCHKYGAFRPGITIAGYGTVGVA